MKTAAVTVTYGSRALLCERVVASLQHQGIDHIVVVDNGSTPADRIRLDMLLDHEFPRPQILRLPSNTGSAGGYRAGVVAAMDLGVDVLWCLDDDNLPGEGTYARLLEHHAQLRRSSSKTAIVGFRTSFPNYCEAAAGAPVASGHPARSSFLGLSVFDVGKYASRRWRRLRPAPEPDRTRPLAGLPWAPYGGLMVSTELVREIGLPDERFFAYGDDMEWTHRITKAGGIIYLALDCPIDDIDLTWSSDSQGDLVKQVATADDRRRELLLTNVVYFESAHWCRSRLVYRLNKAIILRYLRRLMDEAGTSSSWDRALTAIRDGEERHALAS